MNLSLRREWAFNRRVRNAVVAHQLTQRGINVRRYSAVFSICCVALLINACKPTTVAKRSSIAVNQDSVSAHAGVHFAHGVTMFVSALNCEMNAADAARLNHLATETGVNVEVAFVGISANDTLVARQARQDLGLVVPSRIMRDGELAPYKSIGFARMPMALVIKGKQFSTIVSGESATKTLGLIEAAFSPKVAR